MRIHRRDIPRCCPQDGHDRLLLRICCAVMASLEEGLLRRHDFEALITYLKVRTGCGVRGAGRGADGPWHGMQSQVYQDPCIGPTVHAPKAVAVRVRPCAGV